MKSTPEQVTAAMISQLANNFTPWELEQISKPLRQRINDAWEKSDAEALLPLVAAATAELNDLRERLRLEKEQRRAALINKAFSSLTYEEVRELAKIMKEMHP